MSRLGVRVPLPPHMDDDARVAGHPVATWVAPRGVWFDSTGIRLLCRSSWSGRPPVERETTGSSPVRSAVPWWLLVANPDFHSGLRGFDSRPRCDASLVYRQDAWFSARR